MKKKGIIAIAALALLICGACGVNATQSGSGQSIKDVLSGIGSGASKTGSTIGNIIEGVFTKTDLTLEDIAGQWTAEGSAVTFKSDNFLKKAGGIAAAAAVETELDPYYKQYGLTGAVLTMEKDGNFTLAIKKMTLSGTAERKSEGVFTFKFQAFGIASLGSMDAYVEKSGSSINVMFDADKLKKIVSLAATLSGNKLATTASKVLDEYDGICVGFKMKKTGEATGSSTSTSTETESQAGSAMDALKGIFGGGKK